MYRPTVNIIISLRPSGLLQYHVSVWRACPKAYNIKATVACKISKNAFEMCNSECYNWTVFIL